MTRYAIDALTAIRIVREGVEVSPLHQLVAPKSLQTQAMACLYRQVRAGDLGSDAARELLDGITTLRIRLLGDRVSRGRGLANVYPLSRIEIVDRRVAESSC